MHVSYQFVTCRKGPQRNMQGSCPQGHSLKGKQVASCMKISTTVSASGAIGPARDAAACIHLYQIQMQPYQVTAQQVLLHIPSSSHPSLWHVPV